LSNIKQIALGMNMYAQDFDETYPQWRWDQNYAAGIGEPGAGPGSINNGASLWWNAIYPYVKNYQIFVCPDSDYSVVTKADGHWGWFSTNTNSQAWANATRMNVGFADISVSYGSNEPLTYSFPRLASHNRPAETLIVSDMATSLTGWECWDCYNPDIANRPEHSYRLRRAAYPNGTDQAYFWTDPSWLGPFQPAWEKDGRHSNGNNIGFADGHAKHRPVSRTTVELFGLPR
jgi:prepilin-type processing-associated H-X9-DG protein